MVYAFSIFTYTEHLKFLSMKPLYKIIGLFIAVLFSTTLYAQLGRGLVRQPPRITGVTRAASNAAVNARIHANSNSVFGAGNSHPKYNKTEQPAKEEVKKDAINDDAEVKKSKGKKKK